MYNQSSITNHQYLLPGVLFLIPTIVNAGVASNAAIVNRYLLQNIDSIIKNKTITTGTPLRPAPKSGNCTPVLINVGTTIHSTLTTSDCETSGHYADGYYFSATAGKTYTITFNSSEFDTYLGLGDSNGNLIRVDDNSGGGTNAKIVYTAAASGIYIIVAMDAVAGQTGNYSLTLGGDGCNTPPTANTNAASSITPTCATLNGTVTAGANCTATASFDFGSNTSYGENISATPSSVTGTSTVTATKCNLTCDTTYHYRVKATNSNGTSYGSDAGVTTLNLECGVGPYLESPRQGSYESGIGIIRGWACEANTIEIQIDGGTRYEVAYGTSRGDTQGVCGDSNNGFGFTYNFSALSTGKHRLQAFKNNVEFANVNFNVTRLGTDYLRDARGSCTVNNFPDPNSGNSVNLEWSEPNQQFVIKSYNP